MNIIRTINIKRLSYVLFRIVLFVGCLAIIPALSGPAHSATIQVTDFDDDPIADNGTCTLREAIHAANTDSAYDACPPGDTSDSILLQAGVYTLDLANGSKEDANIDGDLDVLDNLVIIGAGEDFTIIDSAAGEKEERILHVPASVISFEVYDLTISGGNASMDIGGNIYNQSTAPGLLLVSVTVSNGTALTGGGIFNSGEMTIRQSKVSNNKANNNIGGGVANGGKMRIEDTEISNNQAGKGGGIVHLQNSLTIFRSIISSNSTTDAVGSGGGILASASTKIIIEYSTIEGNDALTGGGLFLEDGGASIFNSAILNNTAAQQGGGVYDSGNSDIRHSTLSGNSANQGGAVYAASSTQTLLDNNTIAGNTSGGGVFNESGAFFENGLIADNIGGNCLNNKPGAGAYNIDDGNTCQFPESDPNDPDFVNFINTDPMLDPLAENGGPTLTYALQTGSPAIDAISSAVRPNCETNPDQRNFPRGFPPLDPQGTPVYLCDIGAYEAVEPFVVNSTADAVDNDLDDGKCATDVGECTLRAAIQQANAIPGLEEISLPAGTYTLTLAGADEDLSATGDLDIDEPVIIRGAGPGASIIDGGQLDRVIDFYPAVKMRNLPYPAPSMLTNLAVRNGSATTGGGIRMILDDLVIDQSEVSGNNADDGGGIYSRSPGRLNIKNSRIGSNTAISEGGGILNTFRGISYIENSTIDGNQANVSAGMFLSRLHLVNSTISGNMALDSVGAFSTKSMAIIDSSTITDNEAAARDGGLFLGPSFMRNSIVSNNRVGTTIDNCSPTGSKDLISLGYNLSDTDASDCTLDAATDQVETNPQLGPLADNGGLTLTHALQAGSPAIDAGDDQNCPLSDQRGMARPEDGDGDGTAVCDVGAFEFIRAIVPGGGGSLGGGSGGGGGCFITSMFSE